MLIKRMRKEQRQSCALTLCFGHRHELDLRDRTRRRRQPWYPCGHGGRGDAGYTLPDSEAVVSSWGCRCTRPRHWIRHHHSLVRPCRSSAQWRRGLVQISPWEDESLVGDSRSVRLHRLPLCASCIWPVPGAERVQQKRNVAGGCLRGVVRRPGFSGSRGPITPRSLLSTKTTLSPRMTPTGRVISQPPTMLRQCSTPLWKSCMQS